MEVNVYSTETNLVASRAVSSAGCEKDPQPLCVRSGAAGPAEFH